MEKTQNIFRSATVILFLLVGACATFAQPLLPFVAYENNPVINTNLAEWDSINVYLPHVLFHDDLFYMFYIAGKQSSFFETSIGFATSADGFNFTKSNANPIFEPDGTGFDSLVVGNPSILVEEDFWILFYGADSAIAVGPGPFIGRATAPDPTGPWTRLDEPVMQVGSPGEWDSDRILPHNVSRTDSGYVMFYSGTDRFPSRASIGLATSTDGGLTWKKYDDPTTTAPPFAESDPILKPDPQSGSWDYEFVFLPTVLRTGNGWEMFYSGGGQLAQRLLVGLGYATSPDGIVWTRDSNNPILTPDMDPFARNFIAGPAVLVHNDTYFMYYHYGQGPPISPQVGIGVATAPAIITGIDEDIVQNPLTFSLFQNYPNPFNPSTSIEFSLLQSGFVTLKVHNILGEEVATLVSEDLVAGNYKYNWNAQELTSGVYFYRIEVGEYASVKRALLLK